MTKITGSKELYEPYYNHEGEIEKPSQQYFYKRYIQLPPNKRSVNALHRTLKKEEAQGIPHPYRINTLPTLKKYHNQFDWEERYYNKIHQDCENLEDKAIEFNKYMYDSRTQSAMNFEETLKELDRIFYDNIGKLNMEDKTTTQNILQLGTLLKNLHDLQDGRVPKMNEIYAGIKILHEINEEIADHLEDEINELLD